MCQNPRISDVLTTRVIKMVGVFEKTSSHLVATGARPNQSLLLKFTGMNNMCQQFFTLFNAEWKNYIQSDLCGSVRMNEVLVLKGNQGVKLRIGERV